MAKHNDIGRIGELIAQKFLLAKGYGIRDVNYREKWGEIDIVAVYRARIVFVEVKTGRVGGPDPLEHMHTHKLDRQRRVIETYRAKEKVGSCWQCDVLRVLLDEAGKQAFIRHYKRVVL